MKQHYYITTTLPYVNAKPHIGFAMEIVTADTLARFKRQQGFEVTFNTGTDEHGQKIYQKALESNQTPQEYVDDYAATFAQLKNLLNLSYDRFVRTTDPKHKQAAQEFWRRCAQNGDIYKKNYAVKYCVGCELEKTESELEAGRCPLHPLQELELRSEENYFFAFSKYQEQLLQLYSQADPFVSPDGKLKEIRSFVSLGLSDFSISRLKDKMPWGVPVPDDPDHVMYVWFDALVNYISTLGWPDEAGAYATYWPGVQIAGKDNLRQQAAMWQAMLLSAKLPPSKKILINGFVSVDGQKMSKSLGNVISPEDMVERYGIDATRYLLLNLCPITEDVDISWDKLDEIFTADLANGIGNLVSRVAALCHKSQAEYDKPSTQTDPQILEALENHNFPGYFKRLKAILRQLDVEINTTAPWRLEGDALVEAIRPFHQNLAQLSHLIEPVLPQTATKITAIFAGGLVSKIEPLFPRLSPRSLH